ncbi:hypothetical protein TrVE_jg13799 [Triparma verrucosa]|uniref:SGNH hydrolase-type esterase domain-containing protein n=1 Tax=Triparma verrucosa TaxID=1606542 RepID=A0A9W7CDF6_9STRA|nr:hypothetical protein TrVE_jg13799 [Triparma verrucosa]
MMSALFIVVVVLMTVAPSEYGIVESVSAHSRNRGDFGSPLCTRDGQCREDSTVATPRTEFSARSEQQLSDWLKTQALHRRQSIAEFHDGAVIDVLFLGDSITEYLTGKSLEHSCCAEQKRAFSRAWSKHKVLANGISGDQTQHLLWRVSDEGGELSVGKAKINRIVINIGTNNLGAGMSPSMAAEGVLKVAQTVSSLVPTAEIIVEEIFPRANLQQKVAEANEMIRTRMKSRLPSVTLSRCGVQFRLGEEAERESDWTVDRVFMPDALHPNGAGVKKWMDCLQENMILNA